jgi:peptidoglycan/LPS O-acetylase OafA/YrhL
MMAKQRFAVLDGLRGVAALAVVAYHAGINVHLRGVLLVKANPAVDLFFCISGFVLAHAHDKDIMSGVLTSARFALSRWLRFLPVILLGGLIGLAAILAEPAQFPLIYDSTDNTTAFSVGLFVRSLFLIPTVISSQLIWINDVYWSLCIELIVNIFYAFIGYRSRQKYVWLVWLGSVLALIAMFAWFDTIQLIPMSPVRSVGSLLRGFASFFAGVLVYKLWLRGTRARDVNPWLLAGLVALPMLFPYSAPWFMVPFDSLFILAVFPMVVWLGASSTTRFDRAFAVAGEASFPLYATHVPILYMVKGPFEDAGTPVRLLFVLGFTVAMFALSIGMAVYFEKPARGLVRKVRTRLAF